MLSAIEKELVLKSHVFREKKINTIYFGGGTPSLLTPAELQSIVHVISTNYNTAELKEFTLEANPDDVTSELIAGYVDAGVNRISLGVQSFFDEDLAQMNRAHSSAQAHQAIKILRENGIENFSIDFMFALPLLTDEQLIKNIQTAIDYQIPHISCYNLTIEEQTALLALIKKGKIENLSEEKSVRQFEIIMDLLGKNRYHQYEISNYALKGFQSKHNSAYWHQKPYLGIGPSAHSFYNSERTHNLANNSKYIEQINIGTNYSETETLTDKEFYNEFVLTRLRTSKGICERDLEILFPNYVQHFRDVSGDFIRKGYMAYFGDEYRLMPKGKLIADHITSELFMV